VAARLEPHAGQLTTGTQSIGSTSASPVESRRQSAHHGTMSWLILLSVPLLASGCSVISDTGPLPSGPGSVDAGGGTRDAGGSDSGPRLDGGAVDGGDLSCVPGTARCAGDVLVECDRGTPRPTDCVPLMGFCNPRGGTNARCEDWVCAPGRRSCAGDRAVACDARGSTETRETCPFGCDPGTGTCLGSMPTCPGIEVLTPGAVRRDTCAASDHFSYVPDGDCLDGFTADGGDVIFSFTLESERRVLLNLRDDDPERQIDTIIYIRSTCDDASTQLACRDDVPCSDSTLPGCDGTEQVRESRISTTLPAGTYYVIIDSFLYDQAGITYECGWVRLDFLIE